MREVRQVDPAYDLANYRFNLDDEVNQFGYGISFGAGLKVSTHVEAFLRYARGSVRYIPITTPTTRTIDSLLLASIII